MRKDGKLVIKLNKYFFLNLSIFIITLSGSLFIVNMEMQNALEFLGYGIFLSIIFIHYRRICYGYKKKYLNRTVFILGILFALGILVQSLTWMTKFSLIFTMIVIVFSAIIFEGFLISFKDIRNLSYAILYGVVISFVLAICTGIGLFDGSEGTLGFNGGILFKNYFGSDVLAVFIGLFLNAKYGCKYRLDKYVMAVCVILIFLSMSKGAIMLFFFFLFAFSLDKVRKIKREQRNKILFIIAVVVMISSVFFYVNYAMNIDTYMYRIRGLLNYLDYYEEHIYYMVFGSAEMAYEKDVPYVDAIRSTVGWDGTLEFAWLNILIKNGLLGVVGYIIIFIRSYNVMFLKTNDWSLRTPCFAITTICMLSSFVEPYIQSIHAVFGVYCYLIMASLCGIIHCSRTSLFARL